MAVINSRIRTSDRLWSEVVREADEIDGKVIPERDPGYEWSNGRKFVTPVNPYAQNG